LSVAAGTCMLIVKRQQSRAQDIPCYQEKSRNVLGQFCWIHKNQMTA